MKITSHGRHIKLDRRRFLDLPWFIPVVVFVALMIAALAWMGQL